MARSGPIRRRALCSELQNLTVESGVGEFIGMGKAIKSGDFGDLVTEDAEPEEHEANLGQAEEEKNEANSDAPGFCCLDGRGKCSRTSIQ